MTETNIERVLHVGANLATILSACRGLACAVVVVGFPIVAMKALPLLERVVVVLESVELKIDKAYRAMAPVGVEAVGKTVDAIKNVDAKETGKNLTEFFKNKLETK